MLAARHLPDAEGPHHQQADFGQQGDGRREQRPDLVDAVVDLQVVAVGLAEAVGLALFLREGLDHADAGNGVGQHVGDFAPDAVDLLEAVRSRSRTTWIIQAMKGSGTSVTSASRGLIETRITAVITIISTSVAKSSRCSDRNTQMRSVSEPMRAIRSPVRLPPKYSSDKRQQVFVGGGAQVGADAFGHQRQHVGARPAQRPADQRRAEQAAQVHRDLAGVDLLPVLERDQHVVHQRHGQVGRHQRGGGRGQRQQEAGDQLLAVGPGEAPQAQQHPGRGRRLRASVRRRSRRVVRHRRRARRARLRDSRRAALARTASAGAAPPHGRASV